MAWSAARSPVSRAPHTHSAHPSSSPHLSAPSLCHTQVFSHPIASRILCTYPWVSRAQVHHTSKPHVLVWIEVP